jgi:hypothetical protein
LGAAGIGEYKVAIENHFNACNQSERGR